ncbi:MAG: hypothetical protein ACRDRO_02945 [Pseudonocardiaceae bacterium]
MPRVITAATAQRTRGSVRRARRGLLAGFGELAVVRGAFGVQLRLELRHGGPVQPGGAFGGQKLRASSFTAASMTVSLRSAWH